MTRLARYGRTIRDYEKVLTRRWCRLNNPTYQSKDYTKFSDGWLHYYYSETTGKCIYILPYKSKVGGEIDTLEVWGTGLYNGDSLIIKQVFDDGIRPELYVG